MNLSIGKEYPPADEDKYVNQMVDDLQGQLKKLYPEGKVVRQTHPKLHGCVRAEFTILDNLDKNLRVGLFKEPKTFNGYIRFSNASTEIKPDLNKDVRGMAIKLVDVPGEKLHCNPVNTDSQDFNLINQEIFMARTVKEFHKLISAFTSGMGSLVLFILNPFNIHTTRLLLKSQTKCNHILDETFWSATPFLFGDGRAVKFQVTPCNPEGATSSKTDENYLKTNMIKTLSERDVFFDFAIQFQTDADQMPIEDPTVKWTSPFINVAKIRIPKQTFDTEEQNHLGDGFSFSPWHCLPEHRPLGGLNRARKKVYDTMSTFWHDHNSQYSEKK